MQALDSMITDTADEPHGVSPSKGVLLEITSMLAEVSVSSKQQMVSDASLSVGVGVGPR